MCTRETAVPTIRHCRRRRRRQPQFSTVRHGLLEQVDGRRWPAVVRMDMRDGMPAFGVEPCRQGSADHGRGSAPHVGIS